MIVEWSAGLIAYLVLAGLGTIGFLAGKKPFGAFINLVVTIIVLAWLWDVDFLPLLQDPKLLVVGFLAYLAIGGVYSVLRWWLYAQDLAAKVAAIATAPLGGRNALEVEEQIRRRNDRLYYAVQEMAPSANAGLITGWISFWPFDMVLLIIQEPVQRLFRWLGSTYTRLVQSALKAQNLDENGRPLYPVIFVDPKSPEGSETEVGP